MVRNFLTRCRRQPDAGNYRHCAGTVASSRRAAGRAALLACLWLSPSLLSALRLRPNLRRPGGRVAAAPIVVGPVVAAPIIVSATPHTLFYIGPDGQTRVYGTYVQTVYSNGAMQLGGLAQAQSSLTAAGVTNWVDAPQPAVAN